MTRWHGLVWRQRRVVAGIVVTATMAAGVIAGWDDVRDRAPQVRLSSGAAWVASAAVGQLTLLDGASAEVAAEVHVGQPGSDLHTVQQDTVAYALDRTHGSVVRVDGATLAASRAMSPVAGAGGQLAVFPTSHALYTLDTARGLLAKADPETLESQGDPQSLGVRTSQDGAMMDPGGRLWMLDQSSGDLVWFTDGTRHSRQRAHTPGRSRLAQTDRGPVLLDVARGRMELLDADTGVVQQSIAVDVRPDDTVAMSGRLIAVGSRGLLVSCSFDTGSCAPPVDLGTGPADLGQPVEVDGHAVIPDHSVGRVWVVDLAARRVVAERRLFDRPVRFELLSRDGVVFYNDPGGQEAGVIDLDGRIRPITKYKHTSGPAGPSPAVTAPPGAAPGDSPPRTQVVPAVNPRERRPVGDASTRVESPDAQPRIARINVVPDAPRVGEQVRLSADLTGAPPHSMAWTVTGDEGTEATSSAPQFGHVFEEPGTYTVTLVVTAGAGTVRAARQFTVTSERREVRCGDVITTDAVVTQDLVCPGDVALTIAAGDVVLDLGGHTISAQGPSAARTAIRVASGRTITNVTVRNGVVNRYQTGVEMVDVTGMTVADFAVSGTPAVMNSAPGIVGDRARDVRLRSVTLNAYNPFRFNHGSTVVITGSTLTSSPRDRGSAVCANGSLCTIERSSVTVYSLQCHVEGGAKDTASVAIDSSKVSVKSLGAYCATATLTGNDISTLDDVGSKQAYITGNKVTGNEALELWFSFTVTRNVFSGSKRAGLLIMQGQGVVRGNTFTGNPGNGLAVPEADGPVPLGPIEISGNEFVSNGHGSAQPEWADGLAVEQVPAGSVILVSGNHTRNNARYGINVEPGSARDGGGNTSLGDPSDCRTISCSRPSPGG